MSTDTDPLVLIDVILFFDTMQHQIAVVFFQITQRRHRIPGAQRAGSRWIIPADAEKPTDARIKSGKYIKQKADRQKEA